jgi:RNA polymerase sigma-70 factor (ECF subfamily)
MAWVTTIAHRRAVDRVRAERRFAQRERRATAHAIAYDEVAETVQARLDRERVRRCLGALTELQRESVTLAYYGGYTFREVAGLLGVAEGTVKTRMRDGLIRLRDCLGAGR